MKTSDRDHFWLLYQFFYITSFSKLSYYKTDTRNQRNFLDKNVYIFRRRKERIIKRIDGSKQVIVGHKRMSAAYQHFSYPYFRPNFHNTPGYTRPIDTEKNLHAYHQSIFGLLSHDSHPNLSHIILTYDRRVGGSPRMTASCKLKTVA